MILFILKGVSEGINLKNKIVTYFQAWVNNDISCMDQLFNDETYYSECYGPEYHGIDELKVWFKDWHQHGRVLEWKIKDMWQLGNKWMVEWHFECIYECKTDDFDGVSLICFNDDNKIVSLKEFESKAQHYHPYSIK